MEKEEGKKRTVKFKIFSNQGAANLWSQHWEAKAQGSKGSKVQVPFRQNLKISVKKGLGSFQTSIAFPPKNSWKYSHRKRATRAI